MDEIERKREREREKKRMREGKKRRVRAQQPHWIKVMETRVRGESRGQKR